MITSVEHRPQVVLIPPAGGSAVLGRAWTEGLADRAHVDLLRLPRLHDGSLMASARLLAAATPRSGRWVLAGHSLGGLIAFEIVRALQLAGGHLPERLIVMGSQAPDMLSGRAFAALVDLRDDAMLDALVEMGAVDTALREHPMRKLFVPGLRRDLRLLVSYTPDPVNDSVGVPLHAWHGEHDRLAPPARAAAWARHTSVQFHTRTFAGGHFFPVEQLADVLRALPLTTPAECPRCGVEARIVPTIR
ncbi:hypothetical protein GY21_01255 [Cryobacterium roopkundense]|uniref:Surfactin synthase thioesterase subunit n=1 Tax=Cryobacterium roopkundense TaxID=1001240 RepID=A0A099JWG6_9MICO|nr:thioesterase domain-containing protein [Cryobacterium roopkundense]KGJ81743.1 hypothetical protein GY21_01255 [Cryobacterium roopkundense]MBB5642461.1 surfactin synthase thioesterase subunit [Cryobacterium roopkundense]